MAWDVNYFDYGGYHSRVIEVLTKQASQAYLAFLRSMEIPYVICGDQELDLELSLVKLHEYFDIKTIALCGGAIINGAFLKAHLVDEISLVVSPYVSGDTKAKANFDTLGNFINDRFMIHDVKKLADGGIHLIYRKA